MNKTKNKVASLGVSLFLLLTICSSGVVAEHNGSYQSEGVELIGNLSHDFGQLFSGDMPDLVIGALVLSLIIFLGVVLKKIMNKSVGGL